MPHDDLRKLTPERFEDGRAMLLAGLRRRHAFSAAEKGIAEQWRDFSSREIPARIGSAFYGVMCGSDGSSLEYMCAVEVESFGSLSPETGRIRVPPQHYAVFSQPRDLTPGSTWQRILAWLAAGRYESAHKPDFERYPTAPDYSSELDGVEIWVGVVERSGQ